MKIFSSILLIFILIVSCNGNAVEVMNVTAAELAKLPYQLSEG